MSRAREIICYEGPHFLLWRALVKALSPWGSLGLINLYRKDLAPPLDRIPMKLDLTACQATESDIEQLARLISVRYGRREGDAFLTGQDIRQRIVELFRRGHRCFLGKIGKEIVHYNWIFFHWNESVSGTGRFVRLRDDEALLNDAYTSEQWRGRAIHTIVQHHMLFSLQQGGYRTAYTFVSAKNRSSQKTHHRLRWERSGIMLCFIPHGPKEAKIWRIRGTLDPFVEKQIPLHWAQKRP